MTYLSHLLINVGDNPDRPRPGRLWLRNVYHVHQRLCMAFPSVERVSDDLNFLKPFKPGDFGAGQVKTSRKETTGFLFRVDVLPGGGAVILVQSAAKPDWDYAFHNADFLLAARPEIKPVSFNYANHRRLRFRLAANPTRKIDTKSGADGAKRNGKRVPIARDGLIEWLTSKAERSGFQLEKESLSFIKGNVYMNKTKDDKGQRLLSVRYEGILTVTDAICFNETLIKGVGSGKAFGFGLLSVAESR